MYSNQLLWDAPQIPFVYSDQLLGAARHVHLYLIRIIILFFQIIGAGILHGEKSPAVQTVMASPLLSSINISHSAFDGINLISPGKYKFVNGQT